MRKEGRRSTVTDVDPARLPGNGAGRRAPLRCGRPRILDAVFSWDYQDEFFLERRKKTTIIGLACTKADDACFCTAVGSPPPKQGAPTCSSPRWKGAAIACQAVTEKGEAAAAATAATCSPSATKCKALPLAAAGGGKARSGKDQGLAGGELRRPALGGDRRPLRRLRRLRLHLPGLPLLRHRRRRDGEKGSRRKNWDACGFGKFTNHASGHNPRDVQPKRYRNRIMHKFKYYDDKFGQTLCTGCGRCVRACPVGIDIAAILERNQ